MFAPAPIDFRPIPSVGVGVALGLPAGVTAVLVGWLLGGHPGVVLVLTTAAAVGARTAPRAALAAGAACWACYDGFVLHGLGVLDAGTADLVSLAVDVGGATLASAARRMIVRRGYPGVPLPA